jgi:LuxR family transcriptional regulator, maltose regulon positive regulatory protein
MVVRRHLIERLSEGLHRKLTLVSAPAGFGKSTLVGEWVSVCGRPSAWLSLDEGDNDPTRFLTYLVAAMQTVAPNLGEGLLRVLQSPQAPPPESILTALLDEVGTLQVSFVLVLDDYHAINAKPIDDALAFLIERLPPQMHLVIATREDPHVPLARLRAQDQLTELRPADLRFTLAEAAGFLNQIMGLNLLPEDIAALENRTEGWIAGLQLAAISMRGHKDTAGFIKSFTGSHRFVLDYLLEEVLQQQPQSVQTFLLRTSILERMCGSLCAAISPNSAAPGQNMLDTIERANLFVIPLDNERRWYRYHHLFADLLRQRLHQQAADSVPELHRRASQWYEQNGSPTDAVRHALAAEDFERAARLIELAWPAMDGNFQAGTWLSWVKSLPDALIRTRPVLSVGYAWALLNGGALEAALTRLQDAEQWLDMPTNLSERPIASSVKSVVADENQFQSLAASIATARAYHAQALGDVSGTTQYAQRALELLPKDDHLKRGPASALLGLAQWTSGDLAFAHQSLAAAMASFQLAGNLVFAISCTYGLADIRVVQGRLRAAHSTYELSLQLAQKQGEPVLRGTADLYLGLSELHREQGDLGAAEQHLLRSEALGEQAALPDWPHRFCRGQARLKEIQGDLEGALDLFDEAQRLYFRSPVPDAAPVAAMKTRVWVKQGRLSDAMGWARERGLSVDDDLSYLREFEHITLARVLIARYKRDRLERSIHEAIGLLERLLKAAEEGGRMGRVIEILLLQALAHEVLGDISMALVPLERALALAGPEGYVRTFVDEGRPMARLLAEAFARGMMPDYASKLLATCEAEKHEVMGKPPPPILLTSPPMQFDDPQFDDPLSQRELELLRLVAQGLSNREISERLFLALDTVKGHNRRIYAKLQVQRRTEAVARARELGLL